MHDIAAKASAWTQLTTAFNSGCTFTAGRTVAQLRKKWENVKSEAKKAASDRKKEQFKTGGGQVKLEAADEMLTMVEDIINGAMEPIKSCYDSDSVEVLESAPSNSSSEEVTTPVSKKRKTPEPDDVKILEIEDKNTSNIPKDIKTPVPKRMNESKKKTPRPAEATDILREKADELQEAKLAILAQRSLQLTELHDKEVILLDKEIMRQERELMKQDKELTLLDILIQRASNPLTPLSLPPLPPLPSHGLTPTNFGPNRSVDLCQDLDEI